MTKFLEEGIHYLKLMNGGVLRIVPLENGVLVAIDERPSIDFVLKASPVGTDLNIRLEERE